MQLRNIDIHPALRGLIDNMWLFESYGKAPDDGNIIRVAAILRDLRVQSESCGS